MQPERAYIQVRLFESGGELAKTSGPDARKLFLRQKGPPSSFDPLSSPRRHWTNRRSCRGPNGGLTEQALLPEENCSTASTHLLPLLIQQLLRGLLRYCQ